MYRLGQVQMAPSESAHYAKILFKWETIEKKNHRLNDFLNLTRTFLKKEYETNLPGNLFLVYITIVFLYDVF